MGPRLPGALRIGLQPQRVEDFVGINSVEHFLGEYAIANNSGALPSPRSTLWQDRGGDRRRAGLSAAYQLAHKGHAVTIFDERAELGGMMRYGIPGFRTPRAPPRSSASSTSA